MSNRFNRLIEILKLLPRSGHPVSTATIDAQLQSKGYTCGRRTVERDLSFLVETQPNVIERIVQPSEGMAHDAGDKDNDHGAAYHWRLISRKGLIPENLLDDENTALALDLLKQQAFNRLPRSVFNGLDALWKQAAGMASKHTHASSWMRLIQHLPDPLRPQPPAIDEAVQRTVEDAVRRSDALDLTVQTLDGPTRLKRLHPLRLLLQDEILHLLAATSDACGHAKCVHLIPMHRISAATERLSLQSMGIEPDVAQQLALGTRGYVQLRLRVSRGLAEVLFNRPIGTGQTLTPCDLQPERFIVTTDIEDSPQLRKWLARRIGDEVEIVEPQGFLERSD